MQNRKLAKFLGGAVVVLLTLTILWNYRSYISTTPESDSDETSDAEAPVELEVLELGLQARKNLQLVSKAVRPTDYWQTMTIPGMVQDRPGISDRGVASPVVGAVSKIDVYPGDTVRPGERLVTIQLFSEYLQATQTQLFKATQEITLLQTEIDRLTSVASAGGIPKSRIIELNNEIRRQDTLAKAARQELLNRGLTPSQVEQVASGQFVSSIDVVAPPAASTDAASTDIGQPSSVDTSSARGSLSPEHPPHEPLAYEVQSLAVELGQTVQAGQLIANLANHHLLYVVGHAFKREAAFLERVAQEGQTVEVEFADDAPDRWPPIDQTFRIRHLSNSIDPDSRTFDFFISLENQCHRYEKEGETFLVWRFRPGQRARIHVPVDLKKDVFVLPSEAVAHEGPEAFVYRQNGDLFNQISVHVLYEDRRHVVIANNGSITPGTFIAQNAGASLRRVLKAQSASGEQPGLHVHADGTVHAAH